MNNFLYETHLHTKEASACASSFGAEYICECKNRGYAGIFVTDHFFGGNTAVSRHLSWEERINQYCSGYENALNESKIQNEKNGWNFQVFFGIEQGFNGDEYLIYGLDKKWLLNHPEFETMKHSEVFKIVNSLGGLMVQAHPFRSRGYIDSIHLHFRDVHAVEVYNTANRQNENHLAEIYADYLNLKKTSGSDIHNINMFNGQQIDGKVHKCGGMIFDSPLKDIFDFCERVKLQQGKIVLPN